MVSFPADNTRAKKQVSCIIIYWKHDVFSPVHLSLSSQDFFYPLLGVKLHLFIWINPKNLKKAPNVIHKQKSELDLPCHGSTHASRIYSVAFLNVLYWLRPYWALYWVLFLLSINGWILMAFFVGSLSHLNEKAAPESLTHSAHKKLNTCNGDESIKMLCSCGLPVSHWFLLQCASKGTRAGACQRWSMSSRCVHSAWLISFQSTGAVRQVSPCHTHTAPHNRP